MVGKELPKRFKWKEYQTVSPTEKSLRVHFELPGITGLGVILGSVSGGLVVRDFDRMETFDRWAESFPRFATALPTVKTARGRHVYFQGPKGYVDFGDGEYRGTSGHYVCLPPSMHPSGERYEWLIPLPVGNLPAIDPTEAGLLPRGTERTERSERTEQPE